MKYNNLKGSLILTTAALIWGLAFVAQSEAAATVPPFIFNSLRSFIGAFALFVFYIFVNLKEKKPFFPKEREDRKVYLKAAVICGICLTVSVNFQQFGISVYPEGVASEARAGFITAIYVIIVPIFSLFLHKKVGLNVWIGVFIAISGVYLLCFTDGISGIYLGDILVFGCAVVFSVHIMAVDRFVNVTGGIKLSIMQFFFCGVMSLIMALMFEMPKITLYNIINAAPQILYLGIMSSAVAYTLQIVGQKYAEPTVASISMSLESVFAALGGWIISGKTLTATELSGCVLVFIAITVAQINFKRRKAA